MKKIQTLFASMMMSVALIASCSMLTSCGDDDEPSNGGKPAAEEVAGTYTGSLTTTVMGESDTVDGYSLKITKTSDNTVSIETPANGQPPMALPSITVENVKVSKDANGNYSFAEISANGTIGEKKYSITLAGTGKSNQVTVNYAVQYGNMPMSINFTFDGKK